MESSTLWPETFICHTSEDHTPFSNPASRRVVNITPEKELTSLCVFAGTEERILHVSLHLSPVVINPQF